MELGVLQSRILPDMAPDEPVKFSCVRTTFSTMTKVQGLRALSDVNSAARSFCTTCGWQAPPSCSVSGPAITIMPSAHTSASRFGWNTWSFLGAGSASGCYGDTRLVACASMPIMSVRFVV